VNPGRLGDLYRNLSLRAKFALPIAVGTILLFGALIPGVLYLESRAVREGAHARGLQLTKVFAHSSVQALVTDDFLALRQIINSIASEPDVLYAMILDPSGRLLAHSDMREAGRLYTDSRSLRAAGAEAALVQELETATASAYDIVVPIYVLNERRAVARIGLSLAREELAIRRTRNLIVTLGVLNLVAGLGLAAWLARSVTRPVRELVQVAQEIATGNLDRTIAIRTRDEVGQLGETFNRMAASLKARWEIDREISSTLDLDSVLRTIAHHARTLLNVDAAFVASRDPGAGVAAVVASSGAHTDSLRGLEIIPGRGVGGQVLVTGQAATVADCNTDPRIVPEHGELLRHEGLVSALVVPISLKGETRGLLFVANRRPKLWTREDEQVLSRLAGQAAVALENATLYRQVSRHAEELEAKVEARTRELQETNHRLEAASRHKSEFLANMSHELRTPLNAIIGFCRIVMRRCQSVLPAKQYENLEKIALSADQLLRLINDVLDLSKVEAGKMEVRPVTFGLESLIDAGVRMVEPMLGGDPIRLAKDIEADLPLLRTDQDKLKQILINLLSNAVKFTEAGTITVSARRQGGRVAIAVADPGIGIPEDALEQIFEEFRQVDSSSTRRYGGSGLGLSICRRFTRLLGGDIAVRSAVGRGSTFTVTIPIRYEAIDTGVARAGVLGPETPAEPSRNGRLMLAIDDDPDAIYLLRENLGDAGYRVIGALTGEEGVEKARALRPFAITLDIMMPDRDGWEVLRDLKADPATSDIPIIVVSVVDDKEQAYHLGALDYLVKPFEREALLGSLERIVQARGAPPERA
jgi:signal transduction histidine kinase/ActR/RegA family two-component response regulator